jgi:hypothetical protein
MEYICLKSLKIRALKTYILSFFALLIIKMNWSFAVHERTNNARISLFTWRNPKSQNRVGITELLLELLVFQYGDLD